SSQLNSHFPDYATVNFAPHISTVSAPISRVCRTFPETKTRYHDVRNRVTPTALLRTNFLNLVSPADKRIFSDQRRRRCCMPERRLTAEKIEPTPRSSKAPPRQHRGAASPWSELIWLHKSHLCFRAKD